MENNRSLTLTIAEQPTLFEPQRYNIDTKLQTTTPTTTIEAPEKKLTLFALHLVFLEKSTSGIGAIGFIWAPVVLLGGFAIALDTKDFWCITIILRIEGNRNFSRSHELEWQHQATWSITEAGIEVLTSLAMDEKAREKIRATNGMIKELLRLFFRERGWIELSVEDSRRGEALGKVSGIVLGF